MAQQHLRRVRAVTAKRAAAEQAWRDAIVAAHESGESLRVIAEHAGVTHGTISDIVRQELRRRG